MRCITKNLPLSFLRRGSDRKEGPGGLKKIPYTTPSTCLTRPLQRAGGVVGCGWPAKARVGVSRRKQRGQGFTSPLIFLHPLTFAGARTAWGLCARRVRCPSAGLPPPSAYGVPRRLPPAPPFAANSRLPAAVAIVDGWRAFRRWFKPPLPAAGWGLRGGRTRPCLAGPSPCFSSMVKGAFSRSRSRPLDALAGLALPLTLHDFLSLL